jgi:predicted small secreted protein
MNAGIEELAKRLCAAYLSMSLGTSMDWALKNYVNRNAKNGPISKYWIELAERVYKENTNALGSEPGGYA